MRGFNFLVLISVFSLSTGVLAQLDFKELSLNNGGVANNVSVIPMNNETELGKYSLSYNVDKITSGEFNSAKHVIDRLPLQDQAKIYTFWNDALIEKQLTPNSTSNGSVTLSNILNKSQVDTSMIKNLSDYRIFARDNYTKKLNKLIPVTIYEKNGALLKFHIKNNTDFDVSKIRGNLRVVDSKNRRVILDKDLVERVGVLSGNESIFRIYQGSRLDNWKENNDLAFNFTVTGIVFSDGRDFDADKFYQEIQGYKIVLDQSPFTEK